MTQAFSIRRSLANRHGFTGLLCLFTLTLVSTLGFPASTQASTASELLRTQAVFDLAEKDFSSALEKLDKALAADPADLESRYYRGVVYSRLGRYDEACADLESARKGGADNQGLMFELGYAYYRRELLPQAAEAFEASTFVWPSHAPSSYYAGLAHYRLGNFDKCIAPLTRAAELDDAFGASAAYLSAEALVKQGRKGEAEKLLSYALSRFPESVYAGSMENLLAKIASSPKDAKRFDLAAAASFNYDSNVGLFPDGQPLAEDIDSEKDMRLQLTLDSKLRAVRTKKTSLSLGYLFFQSLHRELDRYNVRNHVLSADFRRSSSSFQWGAAYQFIDSSLDNEGYLRTHAVTPTIGFAHGDSRASLLKFQWKDNHYQADEQAVRNGHSTSVNYRHYWLSKAGGNVYAGLLSGRDATSDNEYDQQSYGVETGFQTGLGKWLIKGIFSHQRINYPDSDSGRRDLHTEAGVYAVRPVGGGMEMETSLMHIQNPSNVPDYDYARTIFSLTFRWRR